MNFINVHGGKKGGFDDTFDELQFEPESDEEKRRRGGVTTGSILHSLQIRATEHGDDNIFWVKEKESMGMKQTLLIKSSTIFGHKEPILKLERVTRLRKNVHYDVQPQTYDDYLENAYMTVWYEKSDADKYWDFAKKANENNQCRLPPKSPYDYVLGELAFGRDNKIYAVTFSGYNNEKDSKQKILKEWKLAPAYAGYSDEELRAKKIEWFQTF